MKGETTEVLDFMFRRSIKWLRYGLEKWSDFCDLMFSPPDIDSLDCFELFVIIMKTMTYTVLFLLNELISPCDVGALGACCYFVSNKLD